MAHPKRKISKSRKRKRRTHHAVDTPQLSTCSNCGSAVVYHHVCGECGYYRGKLAVEPRAIS